MAKKYWIAMAIGAVVAVLIVRLFAVNHRTPPGQPQLLAITPQTLPQFAAEFNHSVGVERVVLLMSPTCPVCLEGSSSIDAILQRYPNSNIRVFAVWEPMLPTDWDRPGIRVLARLSDPRVTQVWDRNHLIAGLVEKGAEGRQPACCNRHGAWWTCLRLILPMLNGETPHQSRNCSMAQSSVPQRNWKPNWRSIPNCLLEVYVRS